MPSFCCLSTSVILSCYSSCPLPALTVGGPCFTNPISAQLDSIFPLNLAYLLVLPPLVHFLFMFEFSQKLLVYPCRPPVTFVRFPSHWNGPTLSSPRSLILSLNINLLSWTPASLQDSFQWDSTRQITEEAQICSSEVQVCDPDFSPAAYMQYSEHLPWSFQPRLSQPPDSSSSK